MRLPAVGWKETLPALVLKCFKKSPKAKSPKARAMQFESLEPRQMMTVTPLYWDGGSSGTWNATTANWSPYSTGGSDVVWNSADQAVFNRTASTVTVASGMTADSIQFATTGYTLSGGSIGLSGSAAIDVGSGLTDTIASTITGSSGLAKTSAGTLVLTAGNTYTGGTTISSGILQIGDGTSTANALSSSGTVTNSGTLAFNLGYGGNITVGNVISGTGALNQEGADSLVTLTGASTYTGRTTIDHGLLRASDHILPGPFTVNTYGTLDGDGGTGPVTVSGGDYQANLYSVQILSTTPEHVVTSGGTYTDDNHSAMLEVAPGEADPVVYGISEADAVARALALIGTSGNFVYDPDFVDPSGHHIQALVDTHGNGIGMGAGAGSASGGTDYFELLVQKSGDAPCGPCELANLATQLGQTSAQIASWIGDSLTAAGTTLAGFFGFTDDPLASDNFGIPWSATLESTNEAGLASNPKEYGNGMISLGSPHLMAVAANAIMADDGTVARLFYTSDGTTYQEQGQFQDTLSYDSSTRLFTLIDGAGNVQVYYGFGTSSYPLPVNQRGQLKSITDPGGNSLQMTYDSTTGDIETVERRDSSNSLIEKWVYSHDDTAAYMTDLITKIELQRWVGGTMQTVQQVLYTYYDGTTSGAMQFGNRGDLQLSQVEDPSGNVLDTTYYRYYSAADASADGFCFGELRYMLNNAAYTRLVAAEGSGSAAQSASNSAVADYADDAVQYNSDGQVSQIITAGAGCSVCADGFGTYTYTYETSTNVDGYNNWQTRTLEQTPDGSYNVYYSNFAGELLLKDHYETTDWRFALEYHQYDDQGRMVLSANPLAVFEGGDPVYDDSYADLGVTLSASAGLLETTTYYTSESDGQATLIHTNTTDSTSAEDAGAVAGLVYQHFVQHGTAGTPILQDTTTYFTVTDSDGTIIDLLAASTVYSTTDATDPTSDGAETTSYAYTFADDSVHVSEAAVSLPAIGDYNTTTTTDYDAFGRAVSQEDPAFSVTTSSYDTATGSVTEQIQDDGGLDLTTTYKVDSLGRTVEMTDPDGDATFTVYNDPLHEVRTYTGFIDNGDGTFSQESDGLPPTQVTIDNLTYTVTTDDVTVAGSYSESFTMSATPATAENGAPTGGEAIADVQSLSVSIMNSAGQTVETDAYYNLPDLSGDLTYSGMSLAAYHAGTQWTLGTAPDDANYYATFDAYNADGLLDRVVNPNGTIYRTVYDSLERQTSTWFGTDDTPTTGYWSPSNLDGTNMQILTMTEYDNGGVGDSNITRQYEFPDGMPTTADEFHQVRVTTMDYDWRDRLVSSKRGFVLNDDWSEDWEADLDTGPVMYTVLDNLGETLASYVFSGGSAFYLGDDLSYVYSYLDSLSPVAKTTYAYDDQGHLAETVRHDIGGSDTEETDTVYDSLGLLVSTTDPMGRETTYHYDGAGRLTEQDHPDPAGGTSYTVSYTSYDGDGNVLTQTDPRGAVTSYVYDAAGRLIDVAQPNPDDGTAPSTPGDATYNPTTYYTYDAAGNQYSVTDPDGNVTYYGYDALGRQTTVSQTNPTDDRSTTTTTLTTTTVYDGDDNVLSVTDAAGNETDYEYNALDQMTQKTLPEVLDGSTDAMAHPVYLYSYDNLGNLLETTAPVTDSLSTVTDYTYNVLNEITSVSTPDPTSDGTLTTNYEYDGLGNVIVSVDPLYHITWRYYDGFGRLSGMATYHWEPIFPLYVNSAETYYVYDADNELVEDVTPAGPAGDYPDDANGVQHITAYQYDDLGQQTVVSQLSGTITSSSTTDDNGATHLVYSGTTDLDTVTAYDADGNVASVTDPSGNVTSYVYDFDNRLIDVAQPNPSDGTAPATPGDATYNPTTFYTYDPAGNRLTETDPDGNVTTWAYDSLSRVESQTATVTLHDTTTTTAVTSYLYDDDSNVVRVTDPDGQVTKFTYDALNRETGEKWYANATDADYDSGAGHDETNVVAFTYELGGELHSAADNFSDYTFTYDSLGRTLTVDNNGASGVPDVVLTYTYDPDGNVTSETVTVGGEVNYTDAYTYDFLNQLAGIERTRGSWDDVTFVDFNVNLTWNADGQVAEIDDVNADSTAAATSVYGYDAFGRMTSLTSTGADDSTTFADDAWTYYSNGWVKSYSNAANVADYSAENVGLFTYDHDGQLTAAAPPDGITANDTNSLSQTYDANGNRDDSGFAVNIGSGNQLTSDSTYSDTYDANGNLIEQSTDTTKIDYTYDNRNRLTAVVDSVFEDDSWKKTEEIDYTYDLFNNLIGRTDKTCESDGATVASSASAGYAIENPAAGPGTGANILLAFDGYGDLTDRYIWAPGNRLLGDEQGSASYGAVDLDSPAFLESNASVLWAITDNQASVREVIDSSGTVQEHLAYDPFGRQTALTTGTVQFAFGYDGAYTDPANGLQWHGERVYDPTEQRFVQQDPSGLTFSANTYDYCGENPTTFVDPSGLAQVGTGVLRGVGLQMSDWLFSWFPIHGFVVVDGKGYGEFETNGNVVGQGKIRDSDLDTYPNRNVSDGAYYSNLTEVMLDDERYDIDKFRQGVRDFIATAQKNPGAYIAGPRDCFAFEDNAIDAGLRAARKDGEDVTMGEAYYHDGVSGTPLPHESAPLQGNPRDQLRQIESKELVPADGNDGVTSGPTELKRLQMERDLGRPLNDSEIEQLIEESRARPVSS